MQYKHGVQSRRDKIEPSSVDARHPEATQGGSARRRSGGSALGEPVASIKTREITGSALSLDEVTARYPGDWILLRVTACDEDGIPSAGHVVGRWADTPANDRRIARALSEVLEPAGEPDEQYYRFQAYPRIRTGEAMRKALAEAAEDASEGIMSAPRPR
jgi:hypothetical protein